MLDKPDPEGNPLAWLQSGLEFLRQEAMRLEVRTVVIAITRAIDILSSEIKEADKPVRH